VFLSEKIIQRIVRNLLRTPIQRIRSDGQNVSTEREIKLEKHKKNTGTDGLDEHSNDTRKRSVKLKEKRFPEKVLPSINVLKTEHCGNKSIPRRNPFASIQKELSRKSCPEKSKEKSKEK
jgi:hypothetical protein